MRRSRHWTRRARFALERTAVDVLLHLPRPALARIGARRRGTIDWRTLDEQLAALLELDRLRGAVDLAKGTPAQARRTLATSIALVDLAPASEVVVTGVDVAGAEGRLAARLYTPVGLSAPSPLAVYFHGGGMVTGDLDTHDSLCRHLAIRARIRIVSVEYRLAPEHPFPAAANDATAAFSDIFARAAELAGDPGRLAVMGDSAGGNLSAVVSQRLRGRGVALQVLIYPATDLGGSFPSRTTFADGYLLTRATMAWFMALYLPADVDRRHPDVSPLFHADLSGLPPALVYTAGFDPLRDEGKAYADKLEAHGVQVLHREFEGLVHGFAQMAGAVDGARRAVDMIANDIATAIYSSARPPVEVRAAVGGRSGNTMAG